MESTGDTSVASGLLVPDVSEESMDIYDGLDVCLSSKSPEKSPRNGSQLRDSMDLYEEIVAEEQQSRESSYNELKSRFQAAQNQIKELHRRLEQLELQNTGLSTENHSLKKNISALLRTARQEVTRKDAEIQRLNQRSDKGRHHHQSHLNNVRDPSSSSRTSTTNSTSRPPPPPPPCLPPPPPPPPPPPVSAPLPLPLQPTSPPRGDHPPKDPSQPSRKESDRLTRTSKASSHSHSKRDCEVGDKQTESDKLRSKHRDEKHQTQKQSESTDRRQRSCSDPNKDCQAPDKSRSHRTDKNTGRRYDSRSCRDNVNVEGHHRRSDSKDRKKSSSNQHAERYSDYSKEKEKDRKRDYERKGDRRREDETSRKHKRSSQSETSREREKQRSKESDKGKVDVCGKERREKTDEAHKKSSEDPNVGEKSSVEENSPNRKLSFMETLNLTLSPIKKPLLPFDGSQNDLPAVDKDVEKPSDEDNSQPNVDDMCVIDEVNSSELEGGLEDVAERSPGNLEEMPERFDNVKYVQKKDKSLSETPAVDNSVQTTSAHSKPLDTAKNQITVQLARKSPETSSLKAADKTKSVSNSQVPECKPLEATNGTDQSEMSGSITEQHTSNDLQKADPGNTTGLPAAVTQPTVLSTSVEPPQAVPQSVSLDSITKDAVSSQPRETNVNEEIADKANSESQQISNIASASASSVIEKDGCGGQDVSKDTDAVSSTISLESLPQEGLSLTEAIYVLTNEDANDSNDIATEPSSSTGCIGVSKVSSTTEEKMLPDRFSELAVTPKKIFSPGKRQEKKVEPSSFLPLLHDEDSMMRTLSNLKRIPDAISPLRSPVRITRRNLPHVNGKPGHVKSLQKDFSSTAADANSKKLDVNKENKYPGSPANCDSPNQVDKVSDLPSSLSETDLEEGEILSESEEAAAGSPVPATKRAKLAQPVSNKPSPKSKSVLNKKPEERRVVSKETHETAGVSTRSPRSRFKTVCPAASKASFSTVEEIMETFKSVRTEIRKKYMKLHKTFPKKSFYGVMDNFRESFLEFVDGAHFGEICNQAEELKSTLTKVIASVFCKVSNNGIVKRIFEQQAVDLKQKLWDFVDDQVDYLFRDIQTTLKSYCKPARAQGDGKKTSRDEKESQQTSAKKPQCQQKEAQSAPNSLNQTCVVAPYKTGLGSRGKDIRITHMEKDENADSHPPDCPNTKAVGEFLPPKNLHSTPEKSNKSSLMVCQNGSMLDKTDFELLTEQQASSLTFNLVRDSQMGEIFKCLLQGSDLLESSGITGDNTTWSLSTPRKDGDRFISITTPSKFESPSKLLSPTKFDTPSKLITTWSSISPRKMSSPRLKDQMSLNPALFDESCLLEVPTDNRALLQASLAAQKTYSILAEDLAVSLTIPSPLKSDSHLSFLQPSSMSMQIMSTPDSVISAHISEDALLDGEDATEQDIHLALDTDNSSCGSRSSTSSEPLATPFVFKPDVPMQALVMEKSNDHFIVKIRQANTSADITLTADDTFSRTLIEDDQQHSEGDVAAHQVSAGFTDKLEKDISPCNAVRMENNLSNMSDRSVICQADTGSDTHLTQDEGLTLANKEQDVSFQPNTSKDCFSKEPLQTLPEVAPSDNGLNSCSQKSAVTADESQTRVREEDTTPKTPTRALSCESQKRISPSKTVVSDKSLPHPAETSDTNQQSRASWSHVSDLEREEMDMSESERSLCIAEETSSSPEKDKRDCDNGRKRKRHQEKSKAKRSRKVEKESAEEMGSDLKHDDGEQEWNSPTACLSPNSLSAKNVIRKKGEVVITWTRDEDRAILIDLKTKGASRETFSALSDKLNKPSGQIAHRFYQLMKLFKKQEKMDP
ncbi:CASP8-associated protein 2 [Stegastes partitus]|uniref:CASP8-associated protein 2 n=1 Tax=Stegastes partitus TaxID=144197 RepID=A0A3B4ZYT0_9TELE|nr:PREDICTED: CASP8-associated protein 2 [Stegastes partitus]